MSANRTLVIRDEIHGDMRFDPLLKPIIDHEDFQRLRKIKQVGLADYVFPCATHTRFQHSLGASFLAGQYFDSLVSGWLDSPFPFEGTHKQTTFFPTRTIECVRSVKDHEPSLRFWRQVTSIAGLLHDVGHGPWSHTFEHLALNQNFSEIVGQLSGPVRDYFDLLAQSKSRCRHEDLSVLYTFKILKSLGEREQIEDWERYFLTIAALINGRIAQGPNPKDNSVEFHISERLSKAEIRGGLDFHRLLRPLISGPFDVDRMDYIQRDGRNCGVHISGIEWRRIVSKLLPCLADHQNDAGEPSEVVLVSNIKNQHIIDDFIFTLFQMYAQVYMHPKIVGLEEALGQILKEKMKDLPPYEVTFDKHRKFSDETFRDLLENTFKIEEISRLLLRNPSAKFEVDRFPRGPETEALLRKHGFHPINHLERPMMKDSVGVFLYTRIKTNDTTETFVESWANISPVSQQLFSIRYYPNLWMRGPF